MTNKYKYLFFDADNTIWDFSKSEKWALEKTVTELGVTYIPDYLDVYRQASHRCWRAMEEGKMTKLELRTKRFEWFLDAINIKADIPEVSTNYLTYLGSSAYFIDGVEEMLQRLKEKYVLVLVTNGLKEVQRQRIAISGLNNYFKTIVISDEIGVAKPHKGFFDYVFNEVNTPPVQQTLMIGDNIRADIGGGQKYGMDTCWFTPTNEPTIDGIQPTYTITNITQLENILT